MKNVVLLFFTAVIVSADHVYQPRLSHWPLPGHFNGGIDFYFRPTNSYSAAKVPLVRVEDHYLRLSGNSRLFASLFDGFLAFSVDYGGCTAGDGRDGICTSVSNCRQRGGVARGLCDIGNVCCTLELAACNATVTLNNTYWASPANVDQPCNLTIRLDAQLPEQRRRPICQVRLDFESFSIADPAAPIGPFGPMNSACKADIFQVTGSANYAPVICGDNGGAYMYLDAFNSTSNMTLSFNLTPDVSKARSWRIKIAMLPCGARFLAPRGCLIYLTDVVSRFKSFNGFSQEDVLKGKGYKVCIRREVVNGRPAMSTCFRTCGTEENFSLCSAPVDFSFEWISSFPLCGILQQYSFVPVRP